MIFSTYPWVLGYSDVGKFCWLQAVQRACADVSGAVGLQAGLTAARCGAPDVCPAGSHTGLDLLQQKLVDSK